jgi:pimeloyl-ACP methyl ester carboxylesterase
MAPNSWLRRSPGVLTALLLAAVATSASAQKRDSERDDEKKPLVLQAQGSFYVGGQIVTTEAISGGGTSPVPGIISINHMYVQYQIPQDTKYRYPVIMVHGGGHTGKTYETTPDGREGWFTSFARRGFSPHIVDDPNRGRACCEPTQIHLVRLGLKPGTALPSTNIYSKQLAWNTFRFGPAYPETYANSRFPFAAIDQYAPQWVLTYRDAAEADKIVAAIVALLDKLGPSILMTHSQSGPLGLRATLARPNLVKGYVSIEPAGFAIPAGQSASTIAGVPILTVFGDYLEFSAGGTSWRNSAQATLGLVNAAGGDGTVLVLPDAGIKGNTHMMMMDTNSEQIANIVESWIKEHVRGVRGRYRP